MPIPEPTEEELEIMRDVSARLPVRSVADLDPEDPTQTLDDVGTIDVGPLDVDALPAAEAAEDLDRARAETKGGDAPSLFDDPEDAR